MTETETFTVPMKAGTPNLNKALSQLQGELPRIKKTKTGKVEGENKAGKHFSYDYSYADLGDVVADIGPLLAKYGLAFHCGPTINPADRREMILVWSLLHESGEEKTGEWPLGPVSQKPQSLGSAITYGRRYCFTAATNIVLEDDDDGQRAQQTHRQSAADAWDNAAPAPRKNGSGQQRGQVSRPEQPKPAPEPAADEVDREEPAQNGDDPFYVRPEPEVSTDQEWLTATLKIIPKIGLEACRKLWPEVIGKVRVGTVAKPDGTRVMDLLKARMEALASPQEAAPSEPEAASPVADALDPADPWALKIEEIVDGDLPAARELLDELDTMMRDGTISVGHATAVEEAIVARFPDVNRNATVAALWTVLPG